jgi:hypothetical protein
MVHIQHIKWRKRGEALSYLGHDAAHVLPLLLAHGQAPGLEVLHKSEDVLYVPNLSIDVQRRFEVVTDGEEAAIGRQACRETQCDIVKRRCVTPDDPWLQSAACRLRGEGASTKCGLHRVETVPAPFELNITESKDISGLLLGSGIPGHMMATPSQCVAEIIM